MGTPASVASGATEQHRHVLNDSFSSPQLLAKEPDVSFRVSTAETQHADRQAVPPKPTSHSAKRAHPEGEYFVRRQVPMRAFLERKLESGQINESQRRALKKLRALDDRPTVTFGPASIINIDLPSQVTNDESRIRRHSSHRINIPNRQCKRQRQIPKSQDRHRQHLRLACSGSRLALPTLTSLPTRKARGFQIQRAQCTTGLPQMTATVNRQRWWTHL